MGHLMCWTQTVPLSLPQQRACCGLCVSSFMHTLRCRFLQHSQVPLLGCSVSCAVAGQRLSPDLCTMGRDCPQ